MVTFVKFAKEITDFASGFLRFHNRYIHIPTECDESNTSGIQSKSKTRRPAVQFTDALKLLLANTVQDHYAEYSVVLVQGSHNKMEKLNKLAPFINNEYLKEISLPKIWKSTALFLHDGLILALIVFRSGKLKLIKKQRRRRQRQWCRQQDRCRAQGSMDRIDALCMIHCNRSLLHRKN